VHHALVVLSGLPASGKSLFAQKLSARTGLPIVSTDAVRRALFTKRTYSGAESARVYDTCLRLASSALRKGGGVIIDATNLQEKTRRRWAELASSLDAKFVLVVLTAEEDEIARRMRSRAIHPDPAGSEATWDVYLALKARSEPTKLPHVACDSVSDALEAVQRQLQCLKPLPS
jgi:predicted kinase